MPYFYCDAPANRSSFQTDSAIAASLSKSVDWLQKKRNAGPAVVQVKTVTRKNIMFFSPDCSEKSYLRITSTNTVTSNAITRAIEKSYAIQGVTQTYDSNIPFVLRFMIDNNIQGACWITIHDLDIVTNTSMLHFACPFNEHMDTYVCNIQDQTFHAISPMVRSQIAELRILSFDIECEGRLGIFPTADQDPVIQIASVISDSMGTVLRRVIHTLHSCDPIYNAEVFSYETEEELLVAWRDLVVFCDPDIITGYCIVTFDLPYLFGRADALGISNKFNTLSRIPFFLSSATKHTFESNQSGARESFTIDIPGRFIMDMFQFISTNVNYRLRSYSLNAVSLYFLSDQKEDVHYSQITALQKGDATTRRLLAVYCLKDADLPIRLMKKLMVVPQLIEMSRVTGVPLSFLVNKGQQIKVLSQVARRAFNEGILIPKKIHHDGESEISTDFVGATVIEPRVGFYLMPIATLDFASLYPSIMMAHNLCYRTFVPPSRVAEVILKYGEENITRSPNGDVFVKASVCKGLLPCVLEDLLAARKKAKGDMKLAKDPMEYAVLDGRQLALKISANSVYGYTGASTAQMYLKEIAASVTSFGRVMIETTKNFVETNYPPAKVIYGDTDSVMIRFRNDPTMTVGEAMALGRSASERISNELFVKPIKIEFEKIYFPYMLTGKKRYAAMYWASSETVPDKMDTKGMETVRRDNCLMVSNLMKRVFDFLLKERSVAKAIAEVHTTIAALNTNKIDLSQLVVTKGLKCMKNTKLPHVQVALKMKKANSSVVPVLGDRVAYIIVKGPNKSKVYENAEDPIQVMEKGLQIDTDHYMSHITMALTRVFEHVCGGLAQTHQTLFTGPHMTHIVKAQAGMVAGHMSKFVTKVDLCVGCARPSRPNDPQGKLVEGLCRSCNPHRVDIIMDVTHEHNQAQNAHNRLWTQCQRCTGNRHAEIICNARECTIFYMRKQASITCAAMDSKIEALQLDVDWHPSK